MEIWNVGNRIVNTYIYQIEDGYIMIDTGYDNGLNKVLKKMEKNNLKPENIRYIFLTHAHDDHAGFINEIMNKFPKIKLICNSKSIEVFPFSSMNLNLYDGADYLSPIFTMGQIFKENGRTRLPLAIQVHHAVCDGYYVGMFLQSLQEKLFYWKK